LEIPTVDDVTATLFDDVEHNRSSPRELVERPRGSDELVPYSSILEHGDVHEVSAESLLVQTNNLVEHVDVHSFPNRSPMEVRSIGKSLVSHEAVKRSLEGTKEEPHADVNINLPQNQDEQEAVEIQQQEVHPSENIQHDLELWERVR